MGTQTVHFSVLKGFSGRHLPSDFMVEAGYRVGVDPGFCFFGQQKGGNRTEQKTEELGHLGG